MSEDNNGDSLMVFSSGDSFSVSPSNKFQLEWLLDSACCNHMTPNRDFFDTHHPSNVGTILIGNTASWKVIRIGTVKI